MTAYAPPTPLLTTWRCPKCGRILAKLHLTRGSVVEVKCGSCNTLTIKESA
jgi:LSD1 subclass zinc finger protein